MKNIEIGSVKIPLNEFAISGTAWLGIKKAGKTYGAKGVAEQLIDDGIPLIVFDAIGVWRFLKSPAPGGKGFKVVVAGGEEPDIPLSASNAAEIVRASMRSNVSLVIDLYDPRLSKGDWRKIVQTCFHTLLYENKKFGPRYIILEEAAEYVPQKVYDGETYAAVEKLVRMGGNAHLGIALINQRSQEVNKAVLDLCDNLVLMRQRGNAAIDAVQKWMDKVSPDIADKITASLPNMSGGECWVWAENSDVPVKTRTHKLQSFHPDRTQSGETLKRLIQADTAEFVSKLLAELPKVVEEKKANDPVELRKEITALKKEIQRLDGVRVPAPAPEPFLSEREKEQIEKAVCASERVIDTFQKETAKIMDGIVDIKNFFTGIRDRLSRQGNPTLAKLRKQPPSPLLGLGAVRPTTNGHAGALVVSGGLKRMLVALAQRSPLSKRQLGVRAGLSSTSGTFGTYLSTLRKSGWVDDEFGNLIINNEGRNALGSYEPLPEGEALLNYWLNDLGDSGAARMLRALAEVYPNSMTKDQLGEVAGISSSSGTFGTYLAKLRTLELVEGRGELSASKEFFE